ncbi:MAG: PAS domain S-box protein, partial [Chloroflexales bacterium]|nr:PAS domain S-box protein [Chloroflexales bacterium]
GVPTANGDLRWRVVNAQPVADEHGTLLGVVASFFDITERKRAEQALRESRAKLDAALESMTDAVCISDVAGSFHEFNTAFATFHKFRTKDECARTLAEYPELLDVFMDTGELAPLDMWAVPRALRGEVGTNVEYGLRRKDTGERWGGSYSFAPIRDQAGAIVGSVVVGRDSTARKRAEAALQESERRYRELVQNANSAIIRWACDGTVLFFNEYAQQLFGYRSEEIIGQHVNLLVPATESTGGDLTQLVTDIVTFPERFVNFTNENVCRDGRRVWIAWTNKPIYDAQGNVTAILAVGNDITARKQAEAALRQSEATFASAFRSSPAALLITRLADGRFLEVNEAYCAIVGYARDELLGHLTTEFSIYLNTSDRQAIVDQLQSRGSIREFETRIRHRSGAIRQVIAAQELLTLNGEACILTHLLDITERKRLEAALQTASQRVQLILSSLYGGILVLGEDHRVEFTNQAFCDQFGFATGPEELLGWDATDILTRIAPIYAAPPAALAGIQAILATGQAVRNEEVAITGGRT